MKKLLIISSILFCLKAVGQNKQLPNIEFRDLDGTAINASSISNDGKPMVMIFWSTSCHHTINGIDEISDLYDDWQEETGAKVIIVSTDDKRSSGKVPSFVNGKGWDFDCYLDENGNFRRAMNVLSAPHIIVLDGGLNVIFSQPSFNIGDEEIIYKYISEAKDQ